MYLRLTFSVQDMLYSVTNSNEGLVFVAPSISDVVVVADYLKELYPKLSDESVEEGASVYSEAGL
ncbi:hypothetical protein CPB85DRAFT_1357199 [Mucidula mucida]|nr:hypothetical protein CPB85DRAFT_1357199 [Mucidula mucida]